MSIQILDMVLYGHDNRYRQIPLAPGKVNIITGSSKSGKSSLIDIVDYCFGASKCNVPAGPIRKSVSWFGLKIQLPQGQAFVARRCPKSSAQSSEECFINIANTVGIPPAENLRQTTNTSGLLSYLGNWIGMKENIHIPPDHHTRPALSANARHSLLFCFQAQDEIIRRQQLFHNADDRFVADAIRDVLPYLLGAVDDDYVAKRAELKRLRTALRAIERQLTELKNLRGTGVSKAAALLAQARDVGLTDMRSDTWEAIVLTLRELSKVPLSQFEVGITLEVGEELSSLYKERQGLLRQQQQLREDIQNIKNFESEEFAYKKEVTEQHARLIPIGIFDGADGSHTCPVCLQAMPESNSVPSVEQIKKDFSQVANQLQEVTGAFPQLKQTLADLNDKLQIVRDSLVRNKEETDAVRAVNSAAQTLLDQATKKAHILGRVALYVESLPKLPETENLERRAVELRLQCEALEEELSSERIQDNLISIMTLLSSQMTNWAKNLELEHSDSILRLDLKSLSVIADTIDGPIPMARMGSGENWVSYLLIAHLVLHKWFVKKNRPVPRFLFLDQPSQVYFPPEKDVEGHLVAGSEEDRAAVIRMFKLIFDVIGRLDPEMQVILTEHADISDPWFQQAVTQRWRGGIKLIPDDWPTV